RLEPREVLLPESLADFESDLEAHVPRAAIRIARPVDYGDALRNAMDATMHRSFESTVDEAGLDAAGWALAYAQANQPNAEIKVQRAGVYDPRNHLILDEIAVRSLELLRTLGGERRGALLALLDRTRTPMGARMLR